MQIHINFAAILVCGVFFMVLGAFWYSPILFGRIWMRAMGKTEAEIKAMGPPSWMGYLISFGVSLIMAYVLAHVLAAFKAVTVWEGLQGGFWSWLGFVIMGGLGAVLFEGRRLSLFVLYSGYILVALLGMGVILTIWV